VEKHHSKNEFVENPTQNQNSSAIFTPLNTSVLNLPEPKDSVRVCLDFGTAMSKATLVHEDEQYDDYEIIEVATLGVPTDQEEISEHMLVSSVFIDNDAKLWFGQSAVEMSQLQTGEDQRQRIDNIKRYLSEEGLNEKVSSVFNPTEVDLTFEDMVLAYLAYFTWAMNEATAPLGYSRNIYRRYAMPCFEKTKGMQVSDKLNLLLGQAQILADTFAGRFNDGISLYDFVNAIRKVRQSKPATLFVQESITEPLGVAGSLISWQDNVDSLVMVIDVGAGTSDFSLYRLKFDQAKNMSVALEVSGASRGITEAGNHLDKLLQGTILKKAKISSSDATFRNTLGALTLRLREFKESLFKDGFVNATLFNDDIVEVTLDEFLALPQVQSFSASLKECMVDILNDIDPSFIRGAPHNALAIALTGGGAELPMVLSLAEGTIQAHGKELRLIRTSAFPEWLQEDYPDLELEYPRIAVSLGGARKHILKARGPATVTCDPVGEYNLDRY
jgi:molecular chaperone HscA